MERFRFLKMMHCWVHVQASLNLTSEQVDNVLAARQSLLQQLLAAQESRGAAYAMLNAVQVPPLCLRVWCIDHEVGLGLLKSTEGMQAAVHLQAEPG